MARRAASSRFSLRYWPTWIGMWLLWLNAKVNTYRGTLALGAALGRLARPFMPRRQHIATVNISLCFPELSDERRRQLVLEHFESLGISMLLLGFSWWARDSKLAPLLHGEGLEQVGSALEKERGAILLGMHFTDLDIVGRLIAHRLKISVVYRQHENPVIEHFFRLHRARHFTSAIPKGDTRALLRALRANTPVWYATDQAMRGRHSALVPFFGIPAFTNTGTSRLAKISRAPVIPLFGYRLPGNQGFRVVAYPPLQGFPSSDPIADTIKINRVIEEAIRLAPAQYLWIHRRFKKRRGEPDPY